MTLLRAAYRTMLASYFISSGVKAVRNPAPLVPLAQPLAEKIVPVVKRYAPDEVAGYVPEDPQTLVRLNGAIQIVGGLALATGQPVRLRRRCVRPRSSAGPSSWTPPGGAPPHREAGPAGKNEP